MYIRTYVHTYICTYVHTYIRTYVRMTYIHIEQGRTRSTSAEKTGQEPGGAPEAAAKAEAFRGAAGGGGEWIICFGLLSPFCRGL